MRGLSAATRRTEEGAEVNPLHVAIHVHARSLPRWKASIIDELAALDGVCATVHLAAGAEPAEQRSRVAKLVDRLDQRLFRQADDAWEEVAIDRPLAPAPAVEPDAAT